MSIAFPQGKRAHGPKVNPFQSALGIAFERRSAQRHLTTFNARFLENFAAHARRDVFVRFELAAEAVVLADMLVVASCVTLDHQGAPAIWRENVAQSRENGCVRHGGFDVTRPTPIIEVVRKPARFASYFSQTRSSIQERNVEKTPGAIRLPAGISINEWLALGMTVTVASLWPAPASASRMALAETAT